MNSTRKVTRIISTKRHIKKALITDTKAIHTLVNQFANKDEMLPRSLNEIYEKDGQGPDEEESLR